MSKYFVNFGTGAGNFESDKELNELIQEVNEQLEYTGENVHIEDMETEEDVAYLPWWGTKAEEDEEVTADFGDFGHYGEWVILKKERYQ